MICLPHRVERSNQSGKVCWERCGVVLWDVLYAVVYHDHYSPLGLARSTGANTLYSRIFLRREGVLSLFPSLCSVPSAMAGAIGPKSSSRMARLHAPNVIASCWGGSRPRGGVRRSL